MVDRMIPLFQRLIIAGPLAANELGADPGGQQDGLAHVLLLQTHGHGHMLQVHADEGAADVQAAKEPPALGWGTTLQMEAKGTASASTIMARFRCSQHWAAR